MSNDPKDTNDANDATDATEGVTPRESLIEYPSDFPIKVMGAMQDGFAETIVGVVQGFDPEFHAGKMEMRPSRNGNYLGLTVTVRATSREQLDNLYRALSSHPMVKVVM
ncbi:YbeD family protein [Cupriavidus plantarum]|uniref:YbeD family protein n=1 Tax=Cupriavidus plantarum TaxID=942865 RepID=UPI000EAE9125|nr:YbeD family protein [Cupriavidus plantarum]RLK35872.1 hypothetical protein C7417_3645 [Cupriavidus plantarum]